MICPICKISLTPTKYRGITIHECNYCKGKWFEGEELSNIIEKKDDDLRWMDFSLFEEKGNKYEKTLSERLCPKDSKKMGTFKYLDSGVVINKCEQCGGVWLDNNELQKILKYLETVVITETASDYTKEAWEHFKEIGTEHHGIISEIKDFLVVMKLLEMRIVAENPSMQTVIEKTYEYVPYN